MEEKKKIYLITVTISLSQEVGMVLSHKIQRVIPEIISKVKKVLFE